MKQKNTQLPLVIILLFYDLWFLCCFTVLIAYDDNFKYKYCSISMCWSCSRFSFLNRDYQLSYLSLRTSIGLWTSFLCIVLVATDASSLVCYITRFTEEAFAALICIIFIYEALEKLFHLGEIYAFNMHNNLDELTSYS